MSHACNFQLFECPVQKFKFEDLINNEINELKVNDFLDKLELNTLKKRLSVAVGFAPLSAGLAPLALGVAVGVADAVGFVSEFSFVLDSVVPSLLRYQNVRISCRNSSKAD